MKFLPLLVVLGGLCYMTACTSNEEPLLSADNVVRYPLKVQNTIMNSENVEHTYFIFMAKTMNKAAKMGGLTFTYDSTLNAQVGTLVPLTSGSTASNFMFQLDTMQGYDTAHHSIQLMIPHCQSGRAMFSVNYPLSIGVHQDTATGDFSFIPPNVNDTTDPSYNIIFDKFEFTFNNTVTTGVPDGTFYINPTSVDFFGIPVHLGSSAKNSGAPAGMKRPQMLDTITKVITKYDSTATHQWKSVVIRDKSTQTILRIASPTLAPRFDAQYLNKPAPDFNYIDALISYYKTNSLWIDCRQLDVAGDQIFDKYNQMPDADAGAYYFKGTIGTDNVWRFKNSPDTSFAKDTAIEVRIDMGAVTSNDFFGPGTAPFDTPNKMVKSILVESITSAFSVGLLPAPDGDTLSKAYFKKHQSSYYTPDSLNPSTATGKGPWYDLYAKSIHATGAVIYAFAYDDVLAQDGTIASSDLSDTITVTIGDIGDVAIPNPADAYTVKGVQIDSIQAFSCVDSVCTAKVYWTVPVHQSSKANYFIMLSQGTYSISSDTLAKMQAGNLVPYNQSSGTITLHQKWLGNNLNDVNFQVFTCGAKGCDCPTPANFSNWSCAMGSHAYPVLPSTKPILPVTITSLTPFAKSGDDYTLSVNWTVPAGQSPSAKYYLMLIGNGKDGGFSIPADSIVAKQLGHFATAKETSLSLTLNKKWLQSKPEKIGVQVFTCGSVGCPCPTATDFKSTTCAPGSLPNIPN